MRLKSQNLQMELLRPDKLIVRICTGLEMLINGIVK